MGVLAPRRLTVQVPVGHIKVGGTDAPILEEVATGPLSVNAHPLAGITAAATVSWAP